VQQRAADLPRRSGQQQHGSRTSGAVPSRGRRRCGSR
jgi:hypothetical protein